MTAADDLFALIPPDRRGLSLAEAKKRLRIGDAFVRAAFEKLDTERRAVIVKRGKGGALFLVLSETGITSCRNKNCRQEFVRPFKSKRQTCSKSCSAALRAQNFTPEQRAALAATLSIRQSSPEALARTAAHNKRRWSNPEEHEKLSAMNRERARIRKQDPEAYERYRAMMRIINGSPEKKKMYSELRKQWWRDPEMRKKMTDAVNASEAVQDYRKRYGEENKRRWADPELRAKYTAANVMRNNPELRAKNAERLKKQWDDPVWRARQVARLRDPATRAKAAKTRTGRKNDGRSKRKGEPDASHPGRSG